jgi:lysophospholipase L1-like esterase
LSDGESTTAGDQARLTVAAVGDSITAGSPVEAPPSQYEYWAERSAPALEFRNCGVSGERTDEIALRLDGCARGAEALIVQGGVNDIAQGYPAVQAADQLRAMVVRGRELGLEVFLANVLPWNDGPPGADGAIDELNRLISGIGRDEGVPVLDFNDTLADPQRPDRMPPQLTADGAHPSIAGYRRLGALIARRIGPLAG